MVSSKGLSSFVVGLALFSMFFGAGNLIFPLFVGQLAQDQWQYATFGFILTAVLLPFLGVIAMVVYRGDYSKFFNCLGKVPGFIMILLLLTVWIPFGSAPRGIALAYACVTTQIEFSLPLWVFSIVYCLLVSLVIYQKNRMLEIMGRLLTPLLIGCLALIVYFGLEISAVFSSSAFSNLEIFLRGLREGYNTMDLIASFFFAAATIDILKKASGSEDLSLKKALQASVVGIVLLAIVYVGLICLAASHAAILQDVPKEQLLMTIANKVLGSKLGAVASLAVFLACFTTSVALITVYADFVAEKIFRNLVSYPLAMLMTQLITFGMSIFGLQGVTFITEPILQLFYPLLLGLIIFNVGRQLIGKKLAAQNGEIR